MWKLMKCTLSATRLRDSRAATSRAVSKTPLISWTPGVEIADGLFVIWHGPVESLSTSYRYRHRMRILFRFPFLIYKTYINWYQNYPRLCLNSSKHARWRFNICLEEGMGYFETIHYWDELYWSHLRASLDENAINIYVCRNIRYR